MRTGNGVIILNSTLTKAEMSPDPLKAPEKEGLYSQKLSKFRAHLELERVYIRLRRCWLRINIDQLRSLPLRVQIIHRGRLTDPFVQDPTQAQVRYFDFSVCRDSKMFSNFFWPPVAANMSGVAPCSVVR